MPTISFSIGGEQHDITGLSGDEVVDMIKMNYIREAEAKEPYEFIPADEDLDFSVQEEAERRAEEKKIPIRKEIDLNFAISVEKGIRYNTDFLEEELHDDWINDLETDIEDLIQERIKMKLCAVDNEFDTAIMPDDMIVINDTHY